jgi:hypothetical protein
MRLYPWDHELTSYFRMYWWALLVRRWPRVFNLVKMQGRLSEGEAAHCIRAYVEGRDDRCFTTLRWGGGGAVNHYGGPLKLVTDAVKKRPRMGSTGRRMLMDRLADQQEAATLAGRRS